MRLEYISRPAARRWQYEKEGWRYVSSFRFVPHPMIWERDAAARARQREHYDAVVLVRERIAA